MDYQGLSVVYGFNKIGAGAGVISSPCSCILACDEISREPAPVLFKPESDLDRSRPLGDELSGSSVRLWLQQDWCRLRADLVARQDAVARRRLLDGADQLLRLQC